MGTRTYSRRGAGGIRIPTALGIRTGRFSPATTGALQAYDDSGKDIRGTMPDGTRFRVVDNNLGTGVGDRLNVYLGEGTDNDFTYVIEESDVGVPLIELAEKIRTLAQNPPRLSATEDAAINDTLRSYIQQTRNSFAIPPKTGSDSEYVKELKQAANQPFAQLPLLPTSSGFGETMRTLAGLRKRYTELVDEVAGSSESDAVKRAQVQYLTTQLVNMYERAVSTTGRYSWRNVLNADKFLAMEVIPLVGDRMTVLTPEQNRKNLMSSVKETAQLISAKSDRYRRTAERQVNELMKQRGYDIQIA